MSLVLHCPSCSSRYQVTDSTAGKRVRCQKCGTNFTASSAGTLPELAPLQTVDPLGSLTGADLATLPAAPVSAPRPLSDNPIWGAALAPAPGWREAGVSNPSGGPTDTQMRLVCCGMLVLAAILAIASLALHASTGTVYLAVIVFLPLMLVLGIAGLISPNVVRAVGKYGGHLPLHYKAMGWGVMGIAFVLMALGPIAMFFAGFEPDRPGGRNQNPGLNRSQIATVRERIRTSYAASPNANVVRNVSFEVLWIKGSNPVGDAERTLSDVAGYVPGSFQLAADGKKAAFQYKGDKEMASQYALLLPGPTGLYITFEPQFAE